MQNEEIHKTTGALMIIVALIIDLVQFALSLLHVIPVVGNILALLATSCLTILAWITFYIWFKIHGLDFVKKNRMLIFGGGALVESIPILSGLPGWTFAVILLLSSTKAKKVIATTTGLNVDLNAPRATQALRSARPARSVPQDNPQEEREMRRDRIEQNTGRAKITS